MRREIVLIGLLSLALAACGSSPSSNTAPVAEANTNTAAPQPAEVADPNVALQEGKRLLDENQTEAAIAMLKRAVELNPDLGEAHFNLGIAYALLEMQNEQTGVVAEPANTNSNSKDPDAKKTESEKAFEEAVRAYEKWLKANPEDDVAHYYLGRTYAKLMKDDEAEESFEKAVKIKPEDSEYQTELGAILIKLAQYHQAIKPLKKAIELDSTNGRAIDLLEDAEAGRRRVDYVTANKNANTASTKGSANANADANSSTPEGNTRTPANTTPKKPDPQPKKPDPKDSPRPRTVPTRSN